MRPTNYLNQLFKAGLAAILLLITFALSNVCAQNLQTFPPITSDNYDLPLFGEKPRTSCEKLLDQTFKDSVACAGLTRQQGAQKMIAYGWDCIKLGLPKLALGRFNQAWLLDPNDYHVYWGFASSMFMLKDYDAAIKWFNEAVEINPQRNAKLLCDFGRMCCLKAMAGPVLERRRLINQAIDLFSQAAQVNPNMESIYSNWALALDYKKDYQGALDMLVKAKKLGGTTIDKRFVQHLQYEIGEDQKRLKNEISPLSICCERLQTALIKRCPSESVLAKAVVVNFSIDNDGQIKEIQVLPSSTVSDESKNVSVHTLTEIKRIKVPPSNIAYPLHLCATLSNTIEKINVSLREIDFGPYIGEVQYLIKQNWSPPADNISKETIVTFDVLKDGNIRNLVVAKSCGLDSFDQEGLATVRRSAPFMPLPEGISNNITMAFTFNYNVLTRLNPSTSNLLFAEFTPPKEIKTLKSDEELTESIKKLETTMSMFIYHSSGKPMPEPSKPLTDINSISDLNRWMSYYYLYPQPELLVKALLLAQEKGILVNNKSRAFNDALLSQIFAKNPTKLEAWLDQLRSLKESNKGIVWTALWLANTESSKKQALLFKQQLSPIDQSVIEQTPLKYTPIENMEINSGDVLEMLWASFMITGDEHYIMRIISALPAHSPTPADLRNDLYKVVIAQAAKATLICNAMQHKRILAICVKAKETFPDLKNVLDEVINEASNLKEFKHGFDSILQSYNLDIQKNSSFLI